MAKDKITFNLEVKGLTDIESANTELTQLEQTAEQLKQQLVGLDEGTESFKKIDAELKKTTKSINVLKDATGNLDLDAKFDDIYEAGAPLSSRLGELEDRMYELALAGQTNSQGFRELQQEAVNIRQTIIRVDESIDDLASNKGLASFGDQVRGVGDSLLSLDFDRAAIQAQSLANNASNISFASATNSLKNLGSTFVNLGRALLTNPIFLIAAVVVGIIVVVKELMDQIGLTKVIMEQLGKVFDFLMIPIDALIQGLKDLTDWLGWTNNAAEDAAEKTASALEDAAEKGKSATDKLVQSLDHEIKMMELSGESAEELKQKRLQVLSEQAKAEADAAAARLESARLSGELDEEEIKSLEEKAEQTKLAYDATLNEIEYFNAQQEQLRKDNEAAEKEAAEKKKEEDAEARRIANEERLADEAAYNAMRLENERAIEDLRISNIADDTEREIEENRVKYERLIADTLANEDLLESEKNALIEQYRIAKEAKDKEIEDAQKAADEEKRQAELEEEAARVEARETFLGEKESEMRLWRLEQEGADYEIQKLNEQARLDAELATLTEALDNELITIEEYNKLKEEAAERSAKTITEIEKDEEQKRLNEKKQLEQQKLQAVFNGLQAAADILTMFGERNKKAAKAAFQLNKGIQIAQATIETYKSAVSAYSSLASVPVVGPALGAAAAAAAVTAGLLNIKKIMDTKFDEGGGSGSPSAPSIPTTPSTTAATGAATGGTPAPTPSSVQLFGNEIPGAEGAGNQQIGTRQQPQEIKAFVVESDITSVQNNINTYQERSEIG